MPVKIERSKEWWMAKARLEGDADVGAVQPLPVGGPSPLLFELLEFQRRMDDELSAVSVANDQIR